jgi:NAD(P)-dependent dehydrogenase (short-subunit alcohol dehydrogenase family)
MVCKVEEKDEDDVRKTSFLDLGMWPLVPILLQLLLLGGTVSQRTMTTAAAAAVTTTTTTATAVLRNLVNARVLVTGASRGIGRAMALICHEQGARVAICARTESDLHATVTAAQATAQQQPVSPHPQENHDDDDETSNQNRDSVGSRFLIVPCDVTDEIQVETMVQTIVEQWGGLDILINNVGGQQTTMNNVSHLSSTEFHRMLNLNVVSVHTVTSKVLQSSSSSLRAIVNVSSRAGKMGLPGYAFYCATKFALEGYSATLANELQGRCVVNTISPGMVDTVSFPKPAGRPGVRTAESVRDGLLLLLAQDEITGHYLHVDELDLVRARGLPDTAALKPINEIQFDP